MHLPERSILITLITIVTVACDSGGEHSPKPLTALHRHLPINDTLSVYLGDKYAGKLIASLFAHGQHSINRIVLSVEMKVPGGVQRIGLEEERTYDQNGDILKARQAMTSPAGTNSWELDTDNSSTWWLSVNTAGVINRRTVAPLNEHVRSLTALYNGIFNGTLKKGTSWIDTALELTSGVPVITDTRCVGTPRDTKDTCWEFICTNNLIDRPEKWKIDEQGATILRDIYPYTARSKHSSVRFDTPERTDVDTMFEMMKIGVSNRLRPGTEALLLEFDSGGSIDSSVGGWYLPHENGYLLKPFRKKCAVADDPVLSDAEKTVLCAPTATLQSTHPLIRRLADSLGNGITDPCSKVREFNHAVYQRITRKNIATFSSALETLEAGYGDCGEHAVLLAALLRATGIPARVVYGLLYVPSKKGYYYHAWVLAYTGAWLFADPSHDRFPAHQDRVPLLIDDNGTRMVALGRMIGRLSIEHIQSPQR